MFDGGLGSMVSTSDSDVGTPHPVGMTDTYFEVPQFSDDDDDPLNPSEDKWTLARDLFTSGHTGDAVCAALGIRRSTFWRRAARESWLRRDGPRGATAPEPLDLDAPVDDSVSALDKVWRRVCLALDSGRSADALRWIRIHTLLRTQADADRRHESRETLRDMDAILRTTKGIKAAAEAELIRRKTPILEKGDSTLTESHPADADSPALNRAERRRLLKSVAKRR